MLARIALLESSAHCLSWLLGQGLWRRPSWRGLLSVGLPLALSFLLLRAWPATTLRLGRRETPIFITFHKPRTIIKLSTKARALSNVINLPHKNLRPSSSRPAHPHSPLCLFGACFQMVLVRGLESTAKCLILACFGAERFRRMHMRLATSRRPTTPSRHYLWTKEAELAQERIYFPNSIRIRFVGVFGALPRSHTLSLPSCSAASFILVWSISKHHCNNRLALPSIF